MDFWYYVMTPFTWLLMFFYQIFNSYGVALLFFALVACWVGCMEATFRRWFAAPATQIAMFHTFFNVTCTVLFLPFCGVFVKLSEFFIKDTEIGRAHV